MASQPHLGQLWQDQDDILSFFYWSNSLFNCANPAHLEVLLLKLDTLQALMLFLEH